MNSNNSDNFVCKYIQTDTVFLSINGIILIACVFGAVINLYQLKYSMASKIFDFNVKLFFLSLFVAATGFATTVIVQSSYNLIGAVQGFLSQHSDPLLCLISSGIWVLFKMAFPISLIGFAIERICLSKNLIKLTDKFNWTSVSITLIVWTIPLGYAVCYIILQRDIHLECYCDSFVTVEHKMFVISSTAITAGLHAIALMLYVDLHRTNSKKMANFGINRAVTQSLTQRFQFSNDIKMTKILFPSIVLILICTTAIMCFIVTGYFVFVNDPDINSLNFAQLRNLSASVFILAHPVMCLYQQRKVRKTAPTKVFQLTPEPVK